MCYPDDTRAGGGAIRDAVGLAPPGARAAQVARWAGAAAIATAIGCAGTTHAVFHATDSRFQPGPGPAPRVYVQANLAEAPRVAMRSVGIIEVTVPKRSGMERAIEVAREQGRRLGCWILIDHALFAVMRPSAALEAGAFVLLAHSVGMGLGHHHGPRSLTVEFDCVVPAGAGPAAPSARAWAAAHGARSNGARPLHPRR